MNNNEKDFENYLKRHEKLIKYTVQKIGCNIREDNEDLTVEAQGALWQIYKSPAKDYPPSYLKVVLFRRLIDYLRETLPLSRGHYQAIENGDCDRPISISDESLAEHSVSDKIEHVNSCIDITLLLKSKIFTKSQKAILKLTLEQKSDSEIIEIMGITLSALHVQRFEIRRLYMANYADS